MINGLPEKLKELRNEFRFTQSQVAKRIGVSPSLISCYEMGERTPSAENLLALSFLYQCSVDYLLGKRNRSTKAAIDVTGLTEEQIAAINTLVEAIKVK